jgi:hypothetical protein
VSQLNRDVAGSIPVDTADVRLVGDHELPDLIVLVSERAPLLDKSTERADACLLICVQITHEEVVILAFDRNWR